MGRDGRLRVLPYRRPGADRVRWMAFSRDGEFLCHLEPLPGGSSMDPWEFGSDYLLGVAASELGIETVMIHELQMPGEV